MKNLVIIFLIFFSFSCGKDLYIIDDALFANTGLDTLTVKEYVNDVKEDVETNCVLINVSDFTETWRNGELLSCKSNVSYNELVCGATIEEISGYIKVNSIKDQITVISNCIDSLTAYNFNYMTIDQELFYDDDQRQSFTVLINTVVEKFRNDEMYETDIICPETKTINDVTYGEIQGYIKVCSIRKKITEYTVGGELQDVTIYITSDVKIIN